MLGRLRSVPVLLLLALPARADISFVNNPAPQPGAPVYGPVVNPLTPTRSGFQVRSDDVGAIFKKSRFNDSFKATPFGAADFDAGKIPPVVVPPAAAPAAPSTGLSGRALLEKLHADTAKGFIPHNYDTARDFMYSKADQVTVNGKRGLLDPYSNVFVAGRSQNGGDYPEPGDENGDGVVDHGGFNAEHVWPQSFFESRSPMKSDLHHLMATLIHPNEVRGHLPFGEVQGRPEYTNNGGAKMGGGLFEPPDAAKGRVARAILYFYTRYYDQGITRKGFGDNFFYNRIEMFLRWNREHPPTQFEKDRNDLLQEFQGNRNPFTDDPTLADQIGVAGFQSGFSGMRANKKNRPQEFRSQIPRKYRYGRSRWRR